MPPYGSSISSLKIDTAISYGSCLMNGANQIADDVTHEDDGRVVCFPNRLISRNVQLWLRSIFWQN